MDQGHQHAVRWYAVRQGALDTRAPAGTTQAEPQLPSWRYSPEVPQEQSEMTVGTTGSTEEERSGSFSCAGVQCTPPLMALWGKESRAEYRSREVVCATLPWGPLAARYRRALPRAATQ